VTFGSLFAGIGGFDLGFERAGMRCAWQVEIDDYCRKVLAKHWPNVPRWDDVRTFTGEGFERPDVICGGFPCQDVSRGGLQFGITGSRSGLYVELLRIVRLVRPRFAVLENVPGLLDGGLGRVLGDLAESGFDAEWSMLSACSLGSPHTRERVFVVAYPNGIYGQKRLGIFENRTRQDEQGDVEASSQRWVDAVSREGRIADGIPSRVDRIRSLGNAVVPQVAEWIGRRIMAAEMEPSS
jgi:DNA (cytosine-5)-methyltransferase 1